MRVSVAGEKDAKFLLKAGSPSVSLHPRAPWQIASADLIYEPDDGGGSPTSSDELQVETFQLGWAFPPGSGTVQLVAECTWASAPNRYFMGRQRKGHRSRELHGGCRDAVRTRRRRELLEGFYGPPVMTPLGSTPFDLARFAGGLSYNVPIDSFDRQDLKTVQKDGKKALQVYGAVDVGTYFDDGFALYGRGALTIRIAEDFGLRLSIMLWLLTADHDAAATGEACVQYAGGAFDAGATAHYSLPEDLIRITAGQSGPDVCTQADTRMHFDGGDDWYIWLGPAEHPLPLDRCERLHDDRQEWRHRQGDRRGRKVLEIRELDLRRLGEDQFQPAHATPAGNGSRDLCPLRRRARSTTRPRRAASWPTAS